MDRLASGLKSAHKIIMRIADADTGLVGYVAIHAGGLRKPAFGATRVYGYGSEKEALEDAVRLSRTMSYKSAMAGLPYGGAKAVLFPPRVSRSEWLRSYGSLVNSFRGLLMTGADLGMTPADVRMLKRVSPYIVGTSYDPVEWTVRGFIQGLREAVRFVFGHETLDGRSIAIQGLGKTGMGVLAEVGNVARRIFVSDINPTVLAHVRKMHPSVVVVRPDIIHASEADIFAPCALGGVLSKKTVPSIRARIVAGTANCQLADSAVGKMLHAKKILYIPDYVINAGGLIAVADEYDHKDRSRVRVSRSVSQIGDRVRNLILAAEKNKLSVHEVADMMAEQKIRNFV